MLQNGFGGFNLDFVTKFKNLFLFDIAWNSKKNINFFLKNCKYQPDFKLCVNGCQVYLDDQSLIGDHSG